MVWLWAVVCLSLDGLLTFDFKFVCFGVGLFGGLGLCFGVGGFWLGWG